MNQIIVGKELLMDWGTLINQVVVEKWVLTDLGTYIIMPLFDNGVMRNNIS